MSDIGADVLAEWRVVTTSSGTDREKNKRLYFHPYKPIS